VALLALGLAMSGWGRGVVTGLAIGLISGWLSGSDPTPNPEIPVVLVGHLAGHWTPTAEGPKVMLRGEWLRERGNVEAWRSRAVVSLPLGSVPPSGYRLRVRGYLRRAPPSANGVPTARSGWHVYTKSAYFVESLPDGLILPWVHRLSARVRTRIRAALQSREIAGTPGAFLVQALVLGESWSLPGSWRRGLQACGLSHLVALSGLHVGLLAGMTLALTFWMPISARAILIVTAASGYLMFVGPRPSLIRACCMLVGVWVALSHSRPPVPGNTLVAIAAIMVVADPRLIWDLGFRLTVSATTGILVLSPWLEKRWSLAPLSLSRPLSVTAGAQLATLPWALPSFHLFTPLAPVWNLVAIPWTAVALGTGVVWSFIAVTDPVLAGRLGILVNLVALPFTGVAALPPKVTRPLIVDWGVWQVWILGALLFALLAARRPLQLVSALLIVLMIFPKGQREPSSVELILLDVGQGESIVLRDGPTTALLDGGGWRRGDIGSRILLPVLANLGVRRLDALVLSHPDQDHCRGLVQIASLIPAREVWSSPGWNPMGCVARLHGLPGVGIRSLWAGTSLAVGRWSLQVLNPRPGVRRGVNDRSLVVLASFGGRRVLLTGDIEAAAERELLKRYPDVLADVDILKVAHHGSRTSSTPAWLDHTRPSLALLSAGLENRYGHPAPEVVQQLEERGIRTLRTDEHGLVRIAIDRAGHLRIRLPGSPRPRDWGVVMESGGKAAEGIGATR
jgi:competence protein ComEC